MVSRRPVVNSPGGRSPGESAMRKLLDVLNARPKDRVIAAPGVYDMVSLRMAAAMGFDALYMTGTEPSPPILGFPTRGSRATPTWSGGWKRWLGWPRRR